MPAYFKIPSLLRAKSSGAISIAATILALSACGGGGGGYTSTPTPPPVTPPPVILPAVDVSAIAAFDPGSPLAAAWQKGAFMEIYVRGYKDSDGDGKGDLKGLILSLDYLKDLGIKGIWLMPITRSQDKDHGYAVSDYRNIETDYGNLADFDELIKQAHARGIGVILDYVMNHSAAENPLFVNSSASASNAYRSWYVWQAVAPAGWNIYGANPWKTVASGSYFAPFWDQMPDFNLKNQTVIDYHKDNLRFWMNRGADGFRFDAVGNLVENGANAWENQPENYTIMGQVHSLVGSYSQRYMVCEAPSDPAGFTAPSACGSAFAFNLAGNISKAARNDAAAILAVSAYFKTAASSLATMASNHDLFAGERLWNQVNGDQAQYKLAAATYLLQPGTPFIYYGEEIGMASAASLSGDAKIRTPMSWAADSNNAGFTSATPFRAVSSTVSSQNVASQLADPNSILAFYKAMIKLRNTLPSIAQGSYDAAFVSGSVMGYQRTLLTDQTNERTLVLINYGTSATNVSVSSLPASAMLSSAYPLDGVAASADASGVAQIAMAAQSVRVFTIK
ncbi:MAG: alpha-amylase family glycosyl hydrolase [Pseudomonadota bacterium]